MGSTNDKGKPYDLDHQMATCIQEYGEDREQHWAKKSDGADWGLQQRLYGHAEQIDKLLLEETSTLVSVGDSDDLQSETFVEERKQFFKGIEDQRREWMELLRSKFGSNPIPSVLRSFAEQKGSDARPEDETLLKLVWERLCVVLAEDFTDTRLVRGANRTLQLMQLVIEAKPSQATSKFLKRVSRCFVLGLDPECVILCRGAIDTAFVKAVPNELLRERNVEPDAAYGYTLAQRIMMARDINILDEDDWRAAGRVNGTATDAAHKDPEVRVNVFSVVRDALRVIRKLNPRE